MAARKRRGPRHPYVTITAANPAARTGPRLRFLDPDSGKYRYESLSGATTVEEREKRAVAKSRELAVRRAELERGAPRATGLSLDELVERYFVGHPHLRPRTIETYRGATRNLLTWAKSAKLAGADALTRPRLVEFREIVIGAQKLQTAVGGRRGERQASSQPRSKERINAELRKAKTVLGYLVDAHLLPRLTREDLRVVLKRIPAPMERVVFMRATELRQLLDAALQHDAAKFRETRNEHVRDGRLRGTTPRHKPIAPFVAFCMLSGCRFGEAVGLEWERVDLDSLDHEGREVGEIHLAATGVKTGVARSIDLSVSPALRALLVAMRARAGGETAFGSVFGLTRDEANTAAQRLHARYDAPKAFGWQVLRKTCGTFLSNAPGIFGAASAYRSAKQLGHSVAVAERHYLGILRGIPLESRTLERVMGVEDVMARIVASISEPYFVELSHGST